MSDAQTDQANSENAPRGRLMSLDALRGFDMFWIIGGEHVAKAMEPLGEGGVVSTITTQLRHVEWEGLRFYDLIFPLFLFLIGVSIVLSLDRILATSGRKGALVRIARRSALLFAVGVFYYGGVSRAWPDVQLSGVLPRIALCYFFAASLYVCLSRRGIVIAAIVCLVDFDSIAERFVGGDVQNFLEWNVATGTGGIVIAVVALLLPLLLVRFMYQRKVFIRL